VKKFLGSWLFVKFATLYCIASLCVHDASACNNHHTALIRNDAITALDHVPDFFLIPAKGGPSGGNTISKNNIVGFLDLTRITHLNEWPIFFSSIFYTRNFLTAVCKTDIIYPFHYFW
jgi:hypothetical protein